MSSPVTHVIFDVDGVIIDSESIYKSIISEIFSAWGKEYTDDIRHRVMGKNLKEASYVFNDVGVNLNERQINEEMNRLGTAHFSNLELIPGIEYLIRHLHKHNIPLAFATSSGGYAHSLKEKAHEDLFSLFSHGLCVPEEEEIKHGKPAPDCYLVCAKRFSNPPTDNSTVMVFEDSVNGAWAGVRAGMQVVWIPEKDVRDDKLSSIVKARIDSFENFRPESVGLPPF